MPSMWRASAFYLLFFAALGAVYPFLTLFYQQSGMTPQQIGVLAALLPLVTMIAGPLWGLFADWFHLHRSLLPLAMLATLPCMVFLWHARSFTALVTSVSAFAFFLAPIGPLADSSVIQLLKDQRYRYGHFRLWGSVGYGLVAWIGGEVMEAFGKGAAFVLALSLMLIGAILTRSLVVPRPRPSQSLWPSLRRLATDARWMSFLVAGFLSGIGIAVLNNYLVLYLKSLGASEGLLGFLVGAAALSELPFFWLSASLMRRWTPRVLLIISYALLALRCILTSLLRRPGAALAVQLLNGPTFSAGWAAGVTFASETAPPELGATAQSAFGATQLGLAGTVGGLLGGHLYGTLGAPMLFFLAGLVVLSGLVVFTAGTARAPRPVRA